MVDPIPTLFPRLAAAPYRITSPRTRDYNCIAWAMEDTLQWWWPAGDPDNDAFFWPAGLSREETLDAFLALFSSFGYVVCVSEALEAGCSKIALFANANQVPTHAARQLPSGLWTSKLGVLEDIEHNLHDLAGIFYGSVVKVLRRPSAG